MFSMARLNRVDDACGPCSPWHVSTVLMGWFLFGCAWSQTE